MKLEEVLALGENFKRELSAITNAKALEELRVKYLGRKGGKLTEILSSLKNLSVEEKRKIGPAANALRGKIEAALENKAAEFEGAAVMGDLDVTMPGKKIETGHLHPLTLLENRIREIFLGMNFSVVEGPEVESEYYNFDALNIPAGHPARDMWDTFWLKHSAKGGMFARPNSQSEFGLGQKLLLRTHTSPMQIRYMKKHQPPLQIIVPGRVFRFEATDASHEINFHQVEGLMVGKNISLANLKFVIEHFFRQLFGAKTKIRFRPSYFPFTEPSLEVDIEWKGDWLEVMGAGMVHPSVFENVKYPKGTQGFAFGLGLERLAMIKYKIDDVRLFYSGDLRFIKQF